MYYKKCLSLVRKLQRDGKKKYPFLKWTKGTIMAYVQTPRTYLNPTKNKIIKPIQYEILYEKLFDVTPEKIYNWLIR